MTKILLTVFMGLTALAIVIQMGMLIALFVFSKKASERLQSLLPMIRDTRILLAEATPKVREVLDNLAVLSATARQDEADQNNGRDPLRVAQTALSSQKS